MRAWVAGVMVLALAPAAFAQPGGWSFGNASGAGPACWALKRGEAINTRLMRNNADQMILMAANGGWDHWGDPVKGQLVIDGAAPVEIEVQVLGPLALVLIEDVALKGRVKAARTIAWTFPWGAFDAAVEGLGAAYDGVSRCQD